MNGKNRKIKKLLKYTAIFVQINGTFAKEKEVIISNLTIKSYSLHKSEMVIPSEYIQIIAAAIYAIALFYTIMTFRRTKRLDQICPQSR
jgi:hypothetical protein